MSAFNVLAESSVETKFELNEFEPKLNDGGVYLKNLLEYFLTMEENHILADYNENSYFC
jgi:hypothetical protein